MFTLKQQHIYSVTAEEQFVPMVEREVVEFTEFIRVIRAFA
jgi:hypothetical protein